ncbi:MAG: hypothetical protein Q9160_003415 [Pyrenula sp. 1 TL-2023]
MAIYQCDEGKPSCSRCRRMKVNCSFTETSSGLVIVPTSRSKLLSGEGDASATALLGLSKEPETRSDSVQNAISEFNQGSIPFQPRFPDAERDRLRLMHHYTGCTRETITELALNNAAGVFLWRDYVPHMAFEYDFLLHGLLSVAALHLTLLQNSSQDRNMLLATRHHNLGIASFRQHLVNLNGDNVDALFAFSCMLPLYCFGVHQTAQSGLSPLAKVIELFMLIRGTGVIVRACHEWLTVKSPWRPFFEPKSGKTVDDLSFEIEHVISMLLQRADSSIPVAEKRQVYAGAIGALRQNFLLATTYPHVQLTITFLPTMAPDLFLSMIRDKEPLALAIVANYAVILHWMRSRIWMGGWGRQTFEEVQQVLPSEFHDCIAWAAEEIESGQTEQCFGRPSEPIALGSLRYSKSLAEELESSLR